MADEQQPPGDPYEIELADGTILPSKIEFRLRPAGEPAPVLDDAYWFQRIIRDTNPMTDLEPKIAAHWRKYRPKMSADLVAQGAFDQAVTSAARLTEEAFNNILGGQDFYAAWEQVRNMWAFLPDEEDEPVLGQGWPGDWQAPPEVDWDELEAEWTTEAALEAEAGDDEEAE
jgi:hypothetical protein